MDRADLERRFAFHPADTPQKRLAHAEVRELCLVLAGRLDQLVPDGREKSLSITSLEETMMWANAGLARAGAEPPVAHHPV